MTTGYWGKITSQRLSRRRTLAATGAGALGAAFLAACGGDSGGEDGSSAANADKSGLVTPLTDMGKQAKKGGVKKFMAATDVAGGWDVHVGSSAMEALQTPSMGTLLLDKPGYMKPTDHIQEGDVAESWEFSPDKLTLTMKLRPGVKFAPVAPVNGRELDVQDVLFSWERFGRISPSRADLVNSFNPNAPVLSITAPDARTIVIKLKSPSSFTLSLFAAHNSGKLQIFPKEADTGYDPKRTLIGSGPYYLADYRPSQGFTLKRNPGFYSNDYAWIDTIEMPIITEYAQGLAQLKAGNIYAYQNAGNSLVRPEDVVQFKKDVPEINMYQSQLTAIGFRTFFGMNPVNGQAHFKDERVRQAYSMALDRDLFIETQYNVSKFTSQGLPVSTAYNGALTASNWGDWWLDPQSKDFGPNAQYYKFNIAEAKKLMAAAGFPNGFETVSQLVQGTEYGVNYPTQVEIIEGMVGEIGIKHKHNLIDYANTFQFKIRDSYGKFEGLSYKLGPQASAPEATGQLVYDYHSKASTGWYGFDASGKGDPTAGDPALDAMLDKATAEFDAEKRKVIVYEIQRYLAKPQYGVRWPGGASGFLLAWPVLQNYHVWQNDPRRESVREWLDETKAPVKKA